MKDTFNLMVTIFLYKSWCKWSAYYNFNELYMIGSYILLEFSKSYFESSFEFFSCQSMLFPFLYYLTITFL